MLRMQGILRDAFLVFAYMYVWNWAMYVWMY